MARLRVISVTGGKGGVGKTHLVANLGVLAAKRGLKTVIVDADAGLASAHVLFGLEPSLHVGDVLEGAALDEVLLATPHGVSVLPGGSGERSLTHLAQSQQLQLRGVWESLAERFDVVLLDCPPGLGRDALDAAGAAGRVLLVATPEPTSLVDASVIAHALYEHSGVRAADVVVNGTRSERQGQLAFGKLQASLGALSPSLRYLGSLPDDHNVRRAAALSRPLVTLAPSSPAARALDRWAGAVLDADAPQVAGPTIGLERRLREASATPGAEVTLGPWSA